MASIIIPYSSWLESSAKRFGLETYRPTEDTLDVFSEKNALLTIWKSIYHLEAPIVTHVFTPRLCGGFHANATLTAAVPYFTMNQVRTIYNIPAPIKTNYVVGVLSFGGGLYGSVNAQGLLTNGDVQKYWTALGIATANQPKVIIVALPGARNAPNNTDGGATMENTLDVETIGAACPTSTLTIILYIAPNTLSAFPTLLNYVCNTNVTVAGIKYKSNLISCSWGAPEVYFPSSIMASMNSAFAALNAANINVCVATGDNGSNDGVGGPGKYVDFPSSNPNVTAVGGTTLVCPTGTYDSRTIESAWSSGGGGMSSVYAKPAYQRALPGTMRSTPDIAFLADPNTGVIFMINNQYYVIGGTSVAAPIMAGYLASLVTTRWINPILYAAPSTCFHDIVRGSNGAFSAKTGYDNCTGLGSIIAANLRSQLKI